MLLKFFFRINTVSENLISLQEMLIYNLKEDIID